MRDKSPEIIVLGNQKSGTTAIASLLADYGSLSKTLDIPELWKELKEIQIGQSKLSSFVNSNQHRFSTQLLKEPSLIFMCDELLRLFPDSKYLFVIRHPAENIRSILDRLRISGNLTSADINKDFRDGWKDVFYGLSLSIKNDHYIARLAIRWLISAETYLKHKDRIMLIRYEDFLKDKYRMIKDIAAKLNIKEHHDIRDLLEVQYQPKGTHRGIPWIDFYGGENLSLIEEICKPCMRYFDYEL